MWQAITIFLTSCVLMMTFPTSAEQVVTAVLMDNATILCNMFQTTEISWYGPDESGQRIRYTCQGQKLILDNVPRRNRLHVNVTLPSNISSLIITNAMKSDTGTYACNDGKADYNFDVQVTGPNATLYVTEGTQSVITCNLTSVINRLQWNGPPGATVYNIRGSTRLNIQGLPAETLSRLAVDPTNGALIINNTQRSDDNLYKCNLGGPIHYVQLIVLVSPRNPVITNTTEDIGSGRRVVWATEDSQITIVCQVRGGNPESSVKWLRDGLTCSELHARNSTQRNANGTYDVTSTVIVMAKRSEDRVSYVCLAEHKTWTSPKNDSVELYVRLKPTEPLMSVPGYLQENAALNITCSVSRCRPAANITWSGAGTYVTYNINDKATETFNVTSAYIMRVTRQDNGAALKCFVTHPALSTSLVTSRNLTVWFPPTNVSITSNRDVTEGDKLILKCTTGTSNPVAYIRWSNRTNTPTGELSAMLEQPGKYGGKIWHQNLTITPTRYMDRNSITCSAENPNTTAPSVNDTVILNVKFSPVAKVSIAPNNTITEGDGPVTVQCSASSKPLSYFTVSKDGLTTVISEGQGTQDNHHDYIIPKINRTNAGIYSCTASNGVVGPQNEVEATAELVVQYLPDVHIYGRNVTTSDVHARLVCVPHGVPDKYTFGTWKHLWPGYNGTLRNLNSTYIEDHNATLDLNNISYHDSGVYVCQTSNGVKSAGTQEDVTTQLLYVLVKAPPVILKIPKNVAGGIGSIIAIQLEYYSNTDSGHVTIQHSNSNKVYKGDSVEEIKINNLRVYTNYCPAKVYRINFNISINNQEDFGHYKVNVTNNIGTAEATLEIKPDSKPGKPYEFDSYNLQKNQITLSWYPGFHGGFDQTFVIQNSMDNILWQNASLVPGGKDEELLNTVITKLKPNTIYYFRIYAFNFKGNGELADNVISVKTLSGIPGKPYRFDSYNLQKNQITLSWHPGFHGGFDQTFVIQNSIDNIIWQNASLVPGGKDEELFNTSITKLQPNTIYYFRIYAFNVMGNGELAESVISVKTLSDLDVHQHTGPQNSTIIGGAVGGGVAILAIIVVLILNLRRRTLLSEQNMGRKHTQRSAMTEGAKMEECTSQNTAASIGGEHHANPYLNIQDIPEETNESVNIRSSDTITYEALHPYANIKDNTYSTLNLSPHQKGEERVYENTNISE